MSLLGACRCAGEACPHCGTFGAPVTTSNLESFSNNANPILVQWQDADGTTKKLYGRPLDIRTSPDRTTQVDINCLKTNPILAKQQPDGTWVEEGLGQCPARSHVKQLFIPPSKMRVWSGADATRERYALQRDLEGIEFQVAKPRRLRRRQKLLADT